MNTLHILPNERTANILRRAGVPKESIYAFPVKKSNNINDNENYSRN